MTDVRKRQFKSGDTIYVVDYWGTKDGTQAFKAYAKILEVDEENEVFVALLYGDTYITYSFEDYGRLIFDTAKEAVEAAEKLPKPTTTVYQIIGQKVYQKEILGINGRYNGKAFDLVFNFNKGESVSIKELGSTVFLSRSEAREHKK